MELAKNINYLNYDFTEETWRLIEFYENKFFSKKQLKTANYKEGGIPEEFITWIKGKINSCEYNAIINNMKQYSKNDLIQNYFYQKNKIERTFKKNHYLITKEKFSVMKFSFEDIFEFLLILKTADEMGVLKEFLSVPDIWYIARIIRKNWDFLSKLAV